MWDPQPNACQIAQGLNPDVVQNDVAEQYWGCYEDDESTSSEEEGPIHYKRQPLKDLFHPPTMGAISNIINDHIYEYDPSNNIVSEE